jgi:mono/diheme cytochrome c family protein
MPTHAPNRRSPAGPAAALAALLAFASLAGVAGLAGCKTDPDGAALYRAHCARCHGAEGRGDPRSVGLYPGLDLTASPLVRAGAAARGPIYLRIAEGYGAMPGFSPRLSHEEIEALIDNILRLPPRKAGG